MKERLKCCAVAGFLAAIVPFAACSTGTTEKSGVFTSNDIQGIEPTEYVMCVSKNNKDAKKLIDTMNEVFRQLDLKDIAGKYCDYQNRRSYKTLENFKDNLIDNTGEPIYLISTTLEPFNYSGAYGAYSDGIDVYIMHHVAEKLDRTLIQYDMLDYPAAYRTMLESEKADVLISGIARSDQIEQDFFVSDVYWTGKQQIVCDENENFTKLEQLKGLTIGVVSGRDGEKIVKRAVEKGRLKGTDTTVLSCSSDSEAESMFLSQMCDVLVIDDLPANLIVAKANK